MTTRDDLLSTIEGIHAVGLDERLWPAALAAIARVVGGNAASVEVVDQQTVRHKEMYSYGLPGAEEIAFLAEFPKINIRFPIVARLTLDDLSWDYMILDEATMRQVPFYTEILPRFDIRYFVGGMVLKTASEFATIAVHRSARMGHVQRDGMAMMRLLVPHVRQAFDVARRLKRAGDACDSLEHTLDWLADGVALIKADGAVVYANAAFAAIARRADGIAVRKGSIDISDANARTRYAGAIAAVLRFRNSDVSALALDVPVPRGDGAPAYLLAVRPLFEKERARAAEAVAIVFVHDASQDCAVAIGALRELFGLTAAEAALAQTLQSGVTLSAYARARALSLNTVYTHLRRLCSRMPELIHKLNELRLPLRRD